MDGGRACREMQPAQCTTPHDLCDLAEQDKPDLDRKFHACFDYAIIKVVDFKNEIYDKMRKELSHEPSETELTAEKFLEWQLGYWNVLNPFQELNLDPHKELVYKEVEKIVEKENEELPANRKKRKRSGSDNE